MSSRQDDDPPNCDPKQEARQSVRPVLEKLGIVDGEVDGESEPTPADRIRWRDLRKFLGVS
jgi:hypothetical protein